MKTETPHHVAVEDPDVPADFEGRLYCICSRRWDSPVHKMPDVPREVVEAEARRLGEHHHEGETDG